MIHPDPDRTQNFHIFVCLIFAFYIHFLALDWVSNPTQPHNKTCRADLDTTGIPLWWLGKQPWVGGKQPWVGAMPQVLPDGIRGLTDLVTMWLS